jgi:hypothetical protein
MRRPPSYQPLRFSAAGPPIRKPGLEGAGLFPLNKLIPLGADCVMLPSDGREWAVPHSESARQTRNIQHVQRTC